jgi:hypothetical protein
LSFEGYVVCEPRESEVEENKGDAGLYAEKDGVREVGPGAGIKVRRKDYFIDHLAESR